MHYFSEATNILQAEMKPTINQVIPVVDSLENALESINKDTASINALCECLLNSLVRRFSYLLQSSVHLAATALDATIKLSFIDNTKPGKKFVFDSSIVKRKLKQLLPESAVDVQVNPVSLQPEPAKKRRLLDFISVSLDVCSTYSSGLDNELQSYFDQPRVKTDPIQFWFERNTTSLSTLALQFFLFHLAHHPLNAYFPKQVLYLTKEEQD